MARDALLSLLDEPTDVQMEVIGEVARIITSSLDIGQVYEWFAAELRKQVDFDRASISVVDGSKGNLRIVYLSRQAGSFISQGETLPLEGTATGYVASTQRTLMQGDLAEGHQFWTWKQSFKEGLRSVIVVPLISKDRVTGTLSLFSRYPNAYGAREQRILEYLASQIAPAVENSLLFQEMKDLALALENISDAVIFMDSKGNIKFINRACQEMFGYIPEDVLGQPITIFPPPIQIVRPVPVRSSAWPSKEPGREKSGG